MTMRASGTICLEFVGDALDVVDAVVDEVDLAVAGSSRRMACLMRLLS